MAEPAKNVEVKEAPVAAQPDYTKMNEAIVSGLTAGLKPVIEKLSESSARSVAPARAVAENPPAAIVRPSEEAIAQAMTDGNTAELARLLKLQRAADQQDNQRALGALQSQGGGALSSVARQLAQNLPYYKRFQKEIDAEVDGWQANNPGAIATYDHYKMAEEIVRGRHVDELLEESIRKAREPEPEIQPSGGRRFSNEEPEEREATNIEELYPGFTKEIKGRGRTVEQQLSKMGFKGGFAQVLRASKEVDKLQEEFYDYDPKGLGCGLDMDWTDSKGRKGKNADKNDGTWSR